MAVHGRHYCSRIIRKPSFPPLPFVCCFFRASRHKPFRNLSLSRTLSKVSTMNYLRDTDRNFFLLFTFQAPTILSERPFVASRRCRHRFVDDVISHLDATRPSFACLSVVSRDNFQAPPLLPRTPTLTTRTRYPLDCQIYLHPSFNTFRTTRFEPALSFPSISESSGCISFPSLSSNSLLLWGHGTRCFYCSS
jgi:hypothetical protein